MRHWHFYDPKTGRLLGSGGSFKDEAMMRANLPPGMAAVEGRYDHESQRVDVETGSVVDYQPSQPSAEHSWDEVSKRWALTRAAQERNRLVVEMDSMEKKQGRALREAVLALLPDGPERDRLAAIEDQIAESRALLIQPERKTI